MTEQQKQRTVAMMSEIAGESVTVEKVTTNLYVHGSELACLRIFAKYNANGAAPNPKARVGYSKNLGTHYFSLEM